MTRKGEKRETGRSLLRRNTNVEESVKAGPEAVSLRCDDTHAGRQCGPPGRSGPRGAGREGREKEPGWSWCLGVRFAERREGSWGRWTGRGAERGVGPQPAKGRASAERAVGGGQGQARPGPERTSRWPRDMELCF